MSSRAKQARWIALTAAVVTIGVGAQPPQLERVSIELLDVTPPSSRVSGEPGRMRVAQTTCPSRPATDLRRRIVDIAVQEWGFFGFNVIDQTNIVDPPETSDFPPRRRRPWLSPEESARVAGSIAGYWSITGDGSWILSRQNVMWNGPNGVAERWRDPWSAAFISWVMCESGLGEMDQFHRAIAHHRYIDQAIEARDGLATDAAFTAYDVGEMAVQPGDLVCSARRPTYRNIDERRKQLGSGVRSHCDIVIQLDFERERVLVIGGNVRGAVSLKLLPARFTSVDTALPMAVTIGSGRRSVFAHLQLRAPSIGADGLADNPTLQTVAGRGSLGWLTTRLAGEPPAADGSGGSGSAAGAAGTAR